ncbi:hypothetical protein AAHE18_03G140700 [Arachis hypogaea]
MRAIAVWTCTEEGFLKLAYTRTGKKTNLRQKSSSKFVEAARGSLLLSLVMNWTWRSMGATIYRQACFEFTSSHVLQQLVVVVVVVE